MGVNTPVWPPTKQGRRTASSTSTYMVSAHYIYTVYIDTFILPLSLTVCLLHIDAYSQTHISRLAGAKVLISTDHYISLPFFCLSLILSFLSFPSPPLSVLYSLCGLAAPPAPPPPSLSGLNEATGSVCSSTGVHSIPVLTGLSTALELGYSSNGEQRNHVDLMPTWHGMADTQHMF